MCSDLHKSFSTSDHDVLDLGSRLEGCHSLEKRCVLPQSVIDEEPGLEAGRTW